MAARGTDRGDEAMPRNLGRFNRPRLDFSVLGPLQVRGESGPVDLPSPMERALLAHLVARAGRTVSTDELIDTIWGEAPPRTADKALQNHVLRLRNVLEPERNGSPVLLVTDGSGYRLDVVDDAIDARRFERLVTLGRRAYQEGRIDAAARTLADALELWRGSAYAGLESTPFGGSEARRLEELRLVALEDRIAADLDLGRARETVAELESLVHEHPLRERFWQLLVLALYRADRQADALAAYSRAETYSTRNSASNRARTSAACSCRSWSRTVRCWPRSARRRFPTRLFRHPACLSDESASLRPCGPLGSE